MPFVGTCVKCGATGLRIADARRDCPADAAMADEEALLVILAKEEKE
jgi:hypothetical protein